MSRIHPLMHVPVPWVFILTYVTGMVMQRILPVTIHDADISRIGRVTGFVLLAFGVVVAFSALGIFRSRSTTTVPFETPTTLVTWGPYRVSRNPMYLGLTLTYLGVAGARAEVWPLIVLPLVLAYVNFIVIPVEEKRLRDVFGDSYQRYGANVRRWL